MRKIAGEERSEFRGGPWDGESSPPDSWNGRWKFTMTKEKSVVFLHATIIGERGVIGHYELHHDDYGKPTAWRWEQEETQ